MSSASSMPREGVGSGVGNGGGGSLPGGVFPVNQPPSKRDKRRTLLSDRLVDLSTSFERDRDLHYRNQITALQQEYYAISRADTGGSDMRMLDDGSEEVDMLVTRGLFMAAAAGGSHSGQGDSASRIRASSAGPTGAGVVGTVQPGSYYASFVQEINDRIEEKDVGLAMLHRQHHGKLTSLKHQHERNLHHAREEHLNLAVTMKQRLITRLYNAKKKLAADKEQLEVADNHALLHHPNQFSLGGTSTGSPARDDRVRGGENVLGDIFSGGGGLGRRKLRQRRNEVDDLITGSGGLFDVFTGGRGTESNGIGDPTKSQRRKARAARHSRRMGGLGGEDDDDLDLYGNPIGGASTPSGSGGGCAGVGAAQLASLLYKQQMGGEDVLTKPAWAIEKLFTEKELQMAGNLAALATVRYFSARKGKRARKPEPAGSGADTDGEGTDGSRTPPLDTDAFTFASMDYTTSPLLPAPATMAGSLFTPLCGTGFHNTRSHSTVAQNPPSSSPSARMPLNNATHNHLLNGHPPPTLQHLSFMTPSGSGYGAAAWQALGVPATHFSAGSGSIVNTVRAATLCAPTPAAAKPEDSEQDLEFIRSGVEVEVQADELEEDVEEVLAKVIARDGGWGGPPVSRRRRTGIGVVVEGQQPVIGLGLIINSRGKGKEQEHKRRNYNVTAAVGDVVVVTSLTTAQTNNCPPTLQPLRMTEAMQKDVNTLTHTGDDTSIAPAAGQSSIVSVLAIPPPPFPNRASPRGHKRSAASAILGTTEKRARKEATTPTGITEEASPVEDVYLGRESEEKPGGDKPQG